jgi:hypothetical protein
VRKPLPLHAPLHDCVSCSKAVHSTTHVASKFEAEHVVMAVSYSVAYTMDHYYCLLIAVAYFALGCVKARGKLKTERSTQRETVMRQAESA